MFNAPITKSWRSLVMLDISAYRLSPPFSSSSCFCFHCVYSPVSYCPCSWPHGSSLRTRICYCTSSLKLRPSLQIQTTARWWGTSRPTTPGAVCWISWTWQCLTSWLATWTDTITRRFGCSATTPSLCTWTMAEASGGLSRTSCLSWRQCCSAVSWDSPPSPPYSGQFRYCSKITLWDLQYEPVEMSVQIQQAIILILHVISPVPLSVSYLYLLSSSPLRSSELRHTFVSSWHSVQHN